MILGEDVARLWRRNEHDEGARALLSCVKR